VECSYFEFRCLKALKTYSLFYLERIMSASTLTPEQEAEDLRLAELAAE
jgi:hypothetical protein